MKPTILRGPSIRQSEGRAVIQDHLGLPRYEFRSVVPTETARAAVDAFTAGMEAGQTLPRTADLRQAPLHTRPSRPSPHLTCWRPIGTAAASAVHQRRP